MVRFRIFTVLLVGTLITCNVADETDQSNLAICTTKVKPDRPTQLMIEKVQSAWAAIDPLQAEYVFNTKRADLLEKKMESMEPGADRNLVVYDYGIELLRAGQTEKAIEVFENFNNFFKDKFFINKDKILLEFKKQLAISYMRKGEQDNCILNHNDESCIIPLSPKAQHINREGSSKAIEYLMECLEMDPFDFENQYLLNTAYMSLGGYPDDVPEEFLIPQSYFDQHNFPKFHDIAGALGVDVNHMSGGVCLDDFNNDGYLDIMVSSWGYQDQIRYFENDRMGGFIDKTSATGLLGVTGGLNLKHADYNNDGYLDFIILRGSWLENNGKIPNSLIRNNGDGTFTDVTMEAGVFSEQPTQTAIWEDFNLDGWLDLFIANESSDKGVFNCELYMNNTDGTFTNQTQKAGIAATGYFKGVDSGDLNNDGYPDLYLSNYNGQNLLYFNQGAETGVEFKLAPDSLNVSEPIQSFSTWIFDYNNDGFEDIFVSAYSDVERSSANIFMANLRLLEDPRVEKRTPKLYKNNGDGTFTNVSHEMGLNEPLSTMGCNFGDLDNDGYLDFYAATGDPSYISIVPNKMYRNVEGKTFEDVTFSGGFGHIQKGHAVGFGDLDMDGDQDIYAVMGGAYEGDNFRNLLFENPIGNQNNWINIQLEGRTCNRSAIGARITATIDEGGSTRQVHLTVGSGASFGGNSLMAEMGLGKAGSIQKLEIIWPNKARTRSVFNEVAVNQVVKITEGNSAIEPTGLTALTFAKTVHTHQHE